MSKMIDIISIKKGIKDSNKIKQFIDKHLLWNTYVKKVIDELSEEELSYKKINDFIFFLQFTKYKYNDYGYVISYRTHKDYNILEIKDNEYEIKMVLCNVLETVDIDFTITCSNTTYNYNLPDTKSKLFKGCVYSQLADNINNVLNNTIRDSIKQYILRKD